MKRRRHTPEQIIRKLREAERMLGEGKTIPEAAKELGISEQTYHRWRNQPGSCINDRAPGLAGARKRRKRPPGQGECGVLKLASRPQEDHPIGEA